MAQTMIDVTKDVKSVVANSKQMAELARENSNTIHNSRVEGISQLCQDFGDKIVKVEVSEINDCKYKVRISYKELDNDNLKLLTNKYRTDKIYAKESLIVTESESVD